MPIEIRELVVRVQVEAAPELSSLPLNQDLLNQLKRELAQHCLAEVRREQASREDR